MPPKQIQAGRKPTTRARQSARRREIIDDGIPDVYNDMLAEAAAEEQASSSNIKPSKRRRISEEPPDKIELDVDLFGSSAGATDLNLDNASENEHPPKLQQMVYDEFEGSDESDVEFEDVELEPVAEDDATGPPPEQKSLELDLSRTTLDIRNRGIQRRKPVGPAERKRRLEVHKAHLICLLANLNCRNRWCQSDTVQSILKPLVPRKVTALLHVDESKPQYQRSHSFNKGIEEICSLWKQQWTVTERGMRRASWRDNVDAVKESEDAEDVDFDDFKAAAKSRSGSRDLGAQLFCALLRSVAVDARLVCSLQVLPFSGVAKGPSPEKPKPQYYYAPPQNYSSSSQHTTITRPERATPKKRRIIESPFPIFWAEVFSPSISTWIPLDPLVRNTINKPKTGFEPPASDQLNSMTYVIAVADDGSAKDVTRRYTQWYNAKTRRQRVESTKGGEEWWERTMGVFRKPFVEVRDEIEDASLLKRAESEPMPRNVQDFKGHPVYVLERHLKMNEVIHPRHEVGKVRTGPSKNAKLESVFRRRDVHLCRTSDAWYRRGRDVNEGEQPLKRVISKRRRDPHAVAIATGDFDGDGDEEPDEGMALYAEYQTSIYEPPPVVDGQIPKNAYGNLDVYVSTMIPAGAIHIRHPLAAQAALVLDIDYTDAVTGFEFKGRQGTAVIDGVVVSMNMRNAMIEVIEGLESQAMEEAEEARSKIVLGMWKRWLTALRVRERIHQEYGDRAERDDEDDATYQDDADRSGGGFMFDETEKQSTNTPTSPAFPNLKSLDQLLPPEVVHQEIIVISSPNHLPEFPDSDTRASKHANPKNMTDEGQGGGFIIEDDDKNNDVGGGFVLEYDNNPESSSGRAHTGSDIPIDQGGGGLMPKEEDGHEEDPDHATIAETVERDMGINETAGGFLHDDGQSQPSETAPRVHTSEAVENSHAVAATAMASKHEDGVGTAQPQHHDEVLPSKRGDKTTHTENEAPSRPPHSPPSLRSETSLLSHDPDEEDAEPEWLLNSLGEMD
ncbi:uncharacterized protein Z518_07235 [Rhinocladiella mackenziei CBS 650.93]|uniref:Rhinocladiella mackenziei CBS 650.93 unplaced genomic scaffold supercont1.5, whole genome shotgun sequence n=1 Tax=Rhinocladiella mackenziei CBS 650.93 TaxID=1442369 RepID=A0A0D2FNN4_9EURO|nr:uncharacterized protein Z518_07235 [Rhinocladiella mackenziei CBS 650.93]KIX03682.1 hypothetical protein Z518_07235 [Rhinocladiella mackenziei CBS 650.93]